MPRIHYSLPIPVLIALLMLLPPGTPVHAGDGAKVAAELQVDTSRATIDLRDIVSGGPPAQGIPALGYEGSFTGEPGPTRKPVFVSVDEAAETLSGQSPMILVRAGRELRAYPLEVLTWHEIVNDRIGDVPVAVTYCPLCNIALAFDRRVPVPDSLAGAVYEQNPDADLRMADNGSGYTMTVTFGTSGRLYKSNLLMLDSKTHTLWSQADGKGVVGTLAGVQLTSLSSQVISFKTYRENEPGGRILASDTGYERDYGSNPYIGYDQKDSEFFLFKGDPDPRLERKTRVVGVEIGDEAVAFPYPLLKEKKVLHDVIGQQPLVVFWSPGAASALEAEQIDESSDVGQVGVFSTEVAGRTLDFAYRDGHFVDDQTGSRWTVTGKAVDGPLEGRQLDPIVHDNALWFAWAAFHKNTEVHK